VKTILEKNTFMCRYIKRFMSYTQSYTDFRYAIILIILFYSINIIHKQNKVFADCYQMY